MAKAKTSKKKKVVTKKVDERVVNVPKEVKKEKSVLYYKENMTIGDVADGLGEPAIEVIKILMKMGIMASQTQVIDKEVIEEVALEFDCELKDEIVTDLTRFDEINIEDDAANLEKRPPIVTIMGHVDHGKTTLLDTIRMSNVTKGEAGGITQHIGAYQVLKNGELITFIDTPGHAAFTEMRARGASVTDITILVVAADDGIMPQTREAIEHAKAANCPIIVAINKMDKPDANPDKIMQELTEYELVAEEWGGDTIFAKVSAIKNEGIDELLESILLIAEMAEYKANPNRLAFGTVIEAELSRGKGPVSTLLIQNGSMNIGDIVACGDTFGRVRTMNDENNKALKNAKPSKAVVITGLNEVPLAGDKFMVFTDEKQARQIASERKHKTFSSRFVSKAVSLDNLFDNVKDANLKEINVIIKGDTQGSIEALRGSFAKIDVEGGQINIVRAAVGAITDTDISLALASEAIIIGFNVRPTAPVRKNAQISGIEIRLYNIIYNAIEDLEKALTGMLDPEYEEVVTGQAEVRELFRISKVGTIAGCYITEGSIERNSLVRIIRGGIVVFEGKMASLKRFKDEAKEVKQGYECGIRIEGFNDLKELDIIEGSVEREIKRK